MVIDDGLAPPNSLSLVSVSVRGVRRLRSIENIVLDPGLTLVAGENGSGKSSLVEALEMLLGGTAIEPSAVSRDLSADDDVEVIGLFRSLDGTRSLRVRAFGRDAVRRQFESLIHPRIGALPSALPLPTLREKFAELGIQPPGGTTKQPFVDALDEWISARPDELVGSWVDLPRDLADELPSLAVFRSDDAADQAKRVERLVTQASSQFLAEPRYAGRLSEIAAEVEGDLDPVLDAIREAIKAYCPEVEDVEVSVSYNFARVAPRVQLNLRDAVGETVALSQVGAGQFQRIALAIYSANIDALRRSRRGTLIAYDEPDTHLDYGAQRDLFDIIATQSEIPQVQVLVSTHSVNMMDKVDIAAIRHLRVVEENSVCEVLVTADEQAEADFIESLAAGLGPRNSVLLGERCFFVVEGPTEGSALPILFRKTGERRSFATQGIVLLSTEGSGAIRKFVEILKGRLQRTVVVLADTDAQTGSAQLNRVWVEANGFVEGQSAFYIGAKEFEDAFSDDVWYRAFQSHLPLPPEEQPWLLAEIADARGHAEGMGDGLTFLARRRLKRYVGKPELGRILALTAQPAEIPAILMEAFQSLAP